MSFWDDISNAAGAIKGDVSAVVSNVFSGQAFKDKFSQLLTAAQTQLEATIGQFLMTGQQIADLKARAVAQEQNPKADVVAQATAVAAKADGLNNQYQSIKTDAQALANQLSQLKTSLDNDPTMTYSDTASMGSRVLELFTSKSSLITSAAANVVTIGKRINQHLKDVAGLNSDVVNLENYAEGKGVLAAITSIGAGAGTNIIKPAVEILAVGLAAWLFLPSLFGRSIGAAKKSIFKK